MKLLFIISIFLFSIPTYANIKYIDINKISKEPKYINAYNTIAKNNALYNHWESKWNYSIPKNEVVKNIKDFYLLFNSTKTKNAETYLLLGDLSHFLYNLGDSSYYSIAINNYNFAIELNPSDYRGYWFLGSHYSLSNAPTLAIKNFKIVEDLFKNNIVQPADFWDDYAMVTYYANMPSTCIYAMDMSSKISGKLSNLEIQFGDSIRTNIKAVDKTKNFLKEDIWIVSKDEKLHFTCRPLGLKISVDSMWNTLVYNYGGNQSAFIINPPPLKNKNGNEIGINIAIIMNTASDSEKLEDFVHPYVVNYSNKNKIEFSSKYNTMIAYEVIDSNLYKDYGGGHMYFIGIERKDPIYPGLVLESPAQLPLANSEQYQYFRLNKNLNRFKGKIFYAIMLDSCEDINDQSFTLFKELFENQILIE